ncbi:HAD family phosphatase [Microbacterium protaetiae]|uniref:HAD family phosphatase n=1 Tax=Microbacterium protaetiae TaxID=2509458 RepID=A0A4P6EH25_9MICO|nr:HAD family phosphatase [Microbacterium protaetiae]
MEVDSSDEAVELIEQVAEHVATRLLIALDVDGTVLLEDESPSPGVVAAVGDAHAAGHEVMLATGRSWEGTRGILQLLELEPEYVVCSNGAVIMRRVDGPGYGSGAGSGSESGRGPGSGARSGYGYGSGSGSGSGSGYERFHTETFDPTEVLQLIHDNVTKAHYMVELADGTRLYTEPMDDWNLTHAQRVPFVELSAQPVSRVVVVSPGQTEQDFVDLVRRIGLNQVSYAIGWTAWLDIAPMGVDKASGLELVRGWLGHDPAHVLVIGDGRNDLGMFRWALENGGRAVAMAQGPQEVRDAAGETTLSVADGGVAAVLRKLGR